MYRTIIQFKKNTPPEILRELHEIAESAFNNRAGVLYNVSENPYTLVYEGEFEDMPCLDLGIFDLEDIPQFMKKVIKWDWIDEENEFECCNMLEVFAMPIY